MKLPKNTYTPVPAGTHVGVCYQLIDLGTAVVKGFDGNPTRKHELIIGWELPDEKMEDGRPMTINHWYTFSMNEKANFRKHLEAWRGRAFTLDDMETFEVERIIGTGCLLSVVDKQKRDGSSKTVVGAVAALPKGTSVPALVNDVQFIDLTDIESCLSTLDDLPDFYVDRIHASDEWKQYEASVSLGFSKAPEVGSDFVDPNDPDEVLPF